MVWYGILDCLIFLSWGSPVLLVADMSVMVVSYVKAYAAKTFSRS
jgi:hypothetical protein